MPEATQRNTKHVALYFTPGSSEVMKALAANVRSQGGKTVLIWSSRWKGPESLIMEARAVIIEIGAENDVDIAKCYLEFTQDVEVHFVDHNGEFVDAPAELDIKKATQEESHAETEESEPSDGVAKATEQDQVDGPSDVSEADEADEAAADSHSDGEDNPDGSDGDGEPEAEPDSAESTSGDKLEG